MKNFPFEYKGRAFWYSRSIVASTYVYCRYHGVWYILASQRGPSSTSSFKWNVPGGFLDHGETTQQAGAREVWEETSVKLPVDNLRLVRVCSVPRGKLQHVVFSYVYSMGDAKSLPTTSMTHNEPGENCIVRWIPINSTSQYDWILDHEKNIHEFFKQYIRPSLWQRIKNRLSNNVDVVDIK